MDIDGAGKHGLSYSLALDGELTPVSGEVRSRLYGHYFLSLSLNYILNYVFFLFYFFDNVKMQNVFCDEWV